MFSGECVKLENPHLIWSGLFSSCEVNFTRDTINHQIYFENDFSENLLKSRKDQCVLGMTVEPTEQLQH